jgi:hypothetical protein
LRAAGRPGSRGQERPSPSPLFFNRTRGNCLSSFLFVFLGSAERAVSPSQPNIRTALGERRSRLATGHRRRRRTAVLRVVSTVLALFQRRGTSGAFLTGSWFFSRSEDSRNMAWEKTGTAMFDTRYSPKGSQQRTRGCLASSRQGHVFASGPAVQLRATAKLVRRQRWLPPEIPYRRPICGA